MRNVEAHKSMQKLVTYFWQDWMMTVTGAGTGCHSSLLKLASLSH